MHKRSVQLKTTGDCVVRVRHICYEGSNEANDGAHQRRLQQIVRLGRYLVRYHRVVHWYKYQKESEQVVACSDSDWVGWTRTRRSPSGGCIHRRQHMLCGSQTLKMFLVGPLRTSKLRVASRNKMILLAARRVLKIFVMTDGPAPKRQRFRNHDDLVSVMFHPHCNARLEFLEFESHSAGTRHLPWWR